MGARAQSNHRNEKEKSQNRVINFIPRMCRLATYDGRRQRPDTFLVFFFAASPLWTFANKKELNQIRGCHEREDKRKQHFAFCHISSYRFCFPRIFSVAANKFMHDTSFRICYFYFYDKRRINSYFAATIFTFLHICPLSLPTDEKFAFRRFAGTTFS